MSRCPRRSDAEFRLCSEVRCSDPLHYGSPFSITQAPITDGAVGGTWLFAGFIKI